MHELDAAEAALREATPRAVARYRHVGILTWRLLYQIEAEVVAEVLAAGDYDAMTLNIFRAIDALGYPKDDSPVSFAGHTVVPVIFDEIDKAWSRLH